MNWEAVGAVGETISAVAVLITVGYLAIQIRQNTRTLQTSALSSLHDVHLLTDNNERYVAALMKSQRKEDLTLEERIHMVERFSTIVRGLERIWFETQLGVLPVDHSGQHLDLLRWAMSTAEARRMWAQLAPTFAPGFRTVMDVEVLSEDAPASRLANAFAALDPDWIDQA